MKGIQELSGFFVMTVYESTIISKFLKIKINIHTCIAFIGTFRQSRKVFMHSVVLSVNKHAVITCYISGPERVTCIQSFIRIMKLIFWFLPFE